MSVLRIPSLRLLFVLSCCVFICVGCRSKPKVDIVKSDALEEARGPAAEVRQSVPTPTLSQPTSPTAPAAPSVPEAPATPPEPPKGPITVLTPEGTKAPEVPPPQLTPPAQPAAQTQLTPPTQPAAQAQPTPPAQPAAQAQPTPPAQPEVQTPATLGSTSLATIPGKEVAKSTETSGGVQSLAAPELPAQEMTKPEAAQTIAYEPKLVKARTNIEIILDASGSMAAPFATTAVAKIDLLRNALYDVLSDIGGQQTEFPLNIAIRLFGSKSPASDADKNDTELAIGMGAPELGAIKKKLNDAKAQGLSPLALALTEAAKDFPSDEADRIIVLVADGSDNTDADACQAAAKIESGTKKISIHVIAFDLNPADQAALECIAQKGDGQFFMARNDNELHAALDQAVNSTIPYNLRLSAQAGSLPVPFDIVVFKAGTQTIAKRDKGFGTKLLRLDPGSYDILVEYSASPEKQKPSKMLKGVEILSTTKVEQTLTFELGQLVLSAVGNEGSPAAAKFEISRTGTSEVLTQIETGAEAGTLFLSPGQYDVVADLLESQMEGFELSEKGIELKAGESADRVFRFQKGGLTLKGITTQNEAIPFLYQVTKTGHPELLVSSGAFALEGGTIQLAPGTYDILLVGIDPKMVASPRTKISAIEMKASETKDLAVTFEMGMLKISAVDGQGGKIPAQFVVREHDTQIEMAKLTSEAGDPVELPLPPGSYDIVASSIKSILEPKPSVPVTGVAVAADKPTEQVIKFVLGTLRLRGRNAKEQPIQTQFTVYRAATEEKVSSAPPSNDWMIFDLAPGLYDILAVNVASDEKPQPMLWLKDVKVEDGKSVSHEAIYTAGKLKIIGRGPNNQIITCNFKVFSYGSDRELISGTTGDDWEVFEIQPGKYYMEAGYHDDAQSVLLKKWINIAVGENEVVEEVLRF